MGKPAMKIRNPLSGLPDYEIAPLDASAIKTLATDLRARQSAWAALSFEARGAILETLAAAIEANAAAIADALTTDTGRRAISRIEVAGTVSAIRRWVKNAAQIAAQQSTIDRATVIPGITTSVQLVPSSTPFRRWRRAAPSSSSRPKSRRASSGRLPPASRPNFPSL
jgi:succinate-semialdehyde dehydrogenase / glutarate-semialdehyde dehydrogenase